LVVRAPFDGIVSSRTAVVGQVLIADDLIVERLAGALREGLDAPPAP